ncbi:N-acetyltransferase 9 (GCN5-related [Nesidiocoris tenuis]|uniref:N-acetyltransferase 9 (GCN5-related) n=1 Tax=Nesidiocoris tenuis TaxID=355587 RepID=A0ABN7A8S3_9HEMI|nr:N-acetyltransferase 9 (GCN5-related [Nesidiocoris tenuis]
MRLNKSTKIVSDRVILVPYRIQHVPKYHKWMENELLREQTASERLSLDEEYAMQQTWLHDENKCTFIALDKGKMLETNDEIESMIGDANLYLRIDEDQDAPILIGEVGLMVADNAFRGKGLGKEIALCLIRYGIEAIGIKRFQAVISLKNATSINMFEKLDFEKMSVSEVFDEVTFEREVNSDFIRFILDRTLNYSIEQTVPNK